MEASLQTFGLNDTVKLLVREKHKSCPWALQQNSVVTISLFLCHTHTLSLSFSAYILASVAYTLAAASYIFAVAVYREYC